MATDEPLESAAKIAEISGRQVLFTFIVGTFGLAIGYFVLPWLARQGLVQFDNAHLRLIADGLAYIGFIAAAWVVIVRPSKDGWRVIGFRGCDLSLFWIGGFIAALWIVVSSMLYSMAGVWEAALAHGAAETAPYRKDTGTLVALFVLAGPLAALTEEILFRGLFYRWLRQRLKVPFAALTSALLFTIAHPSVFLAGLPAILDTAFLAILLALLFEARRSLWPGILCHALYNMLLLSLYLYQG